MNHENVTISTKELLKSKSRFNDCMNEQILAAMFLLSSVENELGRLNELCESGDNKELQDSYDSEYDKFNIKVSFKNHTVELGMQSMDVYDAFLSFLLKTIDDADMSRT